MRYVFIPQLRRMRIDRYDASEWAARAPSAMDMGVVFRRVG
jgi:hypothetical protein